MKSRSITVQGSNVTIATRNEQDYISLTDMVRNFEGGSALIEQWLKNKDTVLFLGVWEQLNNPGFNSLEFGGIKNEAGRNSFYLSAKKWTDATSAIGLHAKAGRYGGTFAHRDIAFEFGSWLSPEFKLYLIKEFQRLKDEEARTTALEWSFQRTLAKVNYKIHTDAIKERLIPPLLTKAQTSVVYASEADLLNVALFGITAAQWRQANPDQSGNMRDAATLEQLVVLSNLESINAVLIHQELAASARLTQLNAIAITQMRSLIGMSAVKRLGGRNASKKRDFSGVVSALGDGVADFAIGDAVFGVCDVGQEAAYAEKIAIRATIVARKPERLTHVECAALALIGLTALVSVEDTLHLASGETILIQGGAGGVAGFAIQLAKHIGARVITTASAANHGYLRALGADQIIDYNTQDFTKVVSGGDAVFDTVGGEMAKRAFAVLRPGGRAAFIASGNTAPASPRADVASLRPKVGRDRAHLERIVALVSGGAVRVPEITIYALADATAAHKVGEARHLRGKLVFKVR